MCSQTLWRKPRSICNKRWRKQYATALKENIKIDRDIYISMYIHIGGIMYIMITWAPEGLILLASSLS